MPPLPFALRRAAACDAPSACAFGAAAFCATFAHLYLPADLAAYLGKHYTPAIFSAWIENPRMQMWLASEQSGALIGYALAGPVEVPVADTAPDDGELRKLYVAEAAKGRGVAQALLAPCLEFVRSGGCAPLCSEGVAQRTGTPRKCYIGVWSENDRAIAFYRKAGAVKVGTYEYVVGDARDVEWIMVL